MPRPHGHYSAVPGGSSTHSSVRGAHKIASQEHLVDVEEDDVPVHLDTGYAPPTPVRAFLVRALALLCACSLSIGSH